MLILSALHILTLRMHRLSVILLLYIKLILHVTYLPQ